MMRMYFIIPFGKIVRTTSSDYFNWFVVLGLISFIQLTTIHGKWT